NSHHSRLAFAEAGGNKLSGEGRFSTAGGSGDQKTVPFKNAAAEHLIQRRNPKRKPPLNLTFFGSLSDQSESAREGLQPVIRYADGVQPRHGGLPAQLHHLQLPHHGISLRNL